MIRYSEAQEAQTLATASLGDRAAKDKIISELKARLLKNFAELIDPLDRKIAERFLEEKILEDFNLGCFKK